MQAGCTLGFHSFQNLIKSTHISLVVKGVAPDKIVHSLGMQYLLLCSRLNSLSHMKSTEATGNCFALLFRRWSSGSTIPATLTPPFTWLLPLLLLATLSSPGSAQRCRILTVHLRYCWRALWWRLLSHAWLSHPVHLQVCALPWAVFCMHTILFSCWYTGFRYFPCLNPTMSRQSFPQPKGILQDRFCHLTPHTESNSPGMNAILFTLNSPF